MTWFLSLCPHGPAVRQELAGEQGVSTSVSVSTALSPIKQSVTAYHCCVAEPRFLFSSSYSLLSVTAKRLAFPVATESPKDCGPPKEMCMALSSSGPGEGFPGHDVTDRHKAVCAESPSCSTEGEQTQVQE